jgi:hypothetical protein
MADIILNDQKYTLAGPVEEYTPEGISQAIRLVGTQRRQDNPKVNRYVHRGFPLGVGWARMDRETGRGVGGLLDSTAQTIHRQITIGILNESQTHADPAQHPVKFQLFKGDFWGLFEQDYDSGEVTEVLSRKFGASSNDWTGGGVVLTPTGGGSDTRGQRGFDLGVHKGNLIAAHNGTSSEQYYEVSSSADGVSWSLISGSGFPTSSYITQGRVRANSFADDIARLLPFGNALLYSLYEDPDSDAGSVSQVRVYYTTDEGANWTAGAVIPSGDGPKAFLSWRDPFTAGTPASPVLVLSEGVYRVDEGGTTFTLIYELDGDPNTGRWAVVGEDGALWIGLGSGRIKRLEILAQGRIDVRDVGPPGDGLVTARQGHANFLLAPPEPWVLVAYGGHAVNKTASIWAIDYKAQEDPDTEKLFHPWHSVYSEADANIDLYVLGYSSEDDATRRLFFALEHATDAEMYHLEELFESAVTGVAQKYQLTGILRLPVDDEGDPQTDGGRFRGLVDADDLSATNSGEFIKHEDGLDGDADTTNDRGDYLSGDKDLEFGTNGVGVSAKKAGTRLTLTRDSGDNTQSPKLNEFELQSRNKITTLRGLRVAISVGRTAKKLRITPSTVRSRIRALVKTVPKFSVKYGDEETLFCEGFLRDPTLTTIRATQAHDIGERVGIVTLWLEEIT